MGLTHVHANDGSVITLSDGVARWQQILLDGSDIPDPPFHVRYLPSGVIKVADRKPWHDQAFASQVQISAIPGAWRKDAATFWRVTGPWQKDAATFWNVLPAWRKDASTFWSVESGTPPVVTGWPNLPAGMTQIVSSDWTEAGSWVSIGLDEQWSGNGWVRKTSDVTVETVSGLPTGTNKALQIVTPAGTLGGFGPWSYHGAGTSPAWSAPFREIYFGYWTRIASNFFGHASGSNKHANIIGRKPSGNNDSFWAMPWGAGVRTTFDLRHDASAGLDQSLGCGHTTEHTADVFFPGQWQQIELSYRKPAVSGAGGVWRVYVNGVLRQQRTNVCDYAYSPNSHLHAVGLHGTWGGVGDNLPTANIQHFGPLYIAGRTT